MFDLHIHTNASDGEFSPKEIIEMAKESGLSTIAITDHDTTESLDEAISIAKNEDIEVIPGIELNANVAFGQMHILGYYIDYNDPIFKERMKEIQEERNARNIEFASTFNKIGIQISLENISKRSKSNAISRAHFAKELYDNHYTNSINEAYSKFFNTTPFRDIRETTFSPEQTIRTIKDASGIAVLAHPQTLRLNETQLDETLGLLKKYGLDGIECYHSKQTPEQHALYSRLALKHDLIMTGGSDFHGPNLKPDITMGINFSNSSLNDEIVISSLKNRITRNSVFKSFSI